MTINIKKPLQIFYGTSPQICPYLPEKNEKKIITEISGLLPSQQLNLQMQGLDDLIEQLIGPHVMIAMPVFL